MHIWDDKPSLEMFNKTSMKKMDYSHCPLKKRPIKFVKYIKEEMDFGKYYFIFTHIFFCKRVIIIINIICIYTHFYDIIRANIVP